MLQDTTYKSPALLTGQPTEAKLYRDNHINLIKNLNEIILLLGDNLTILPMFINFPNAIH